MSSSRPFVVVGCSRCGLTAWPRPAMCRRCGSLTFEDVPAGEGTLEEITEAQPATLGTVRTAAGPIVVARVICARAGARVTLRVRDGAVEAQ
jgi:uncharacterized OB-fold protein